MVTLADIFRQHGPAYQQKYTHQMPASHKKAMQAICCCRTAVLGGHLLTCPACDHRQFRYHSCRNRHCPQCQGDKGQQWLSNQLEMLLPVPYFLLTFTLPAELRPLARSQQKLFYNLLFRASAAATQALAHNPRFLGGAIGMVGVLHTWGRNLAYHPHVHYLVPAGAWDGLVWRYRHQRRFFLPVKVLSLLFRAKFRDALQQAGCFDQVPPVVWRKDWVVHCQPVGRGIRALTYLAAYIFRVVLSNSRLVSCTDEAVTFRYRPSSSDQWRLCTLTAMEFMRRFLQHVLPKGFVKVRYYGFFSPGQRQTLAQIRDFLTPRHLPAPPKQSEKEQTQGYACPVWLCCPHCGQPLQRQRTMPARQRRWQPP
jgi:hypothetical protein